MRQYFNIFNTVAAATTLNLSYWPPKRIFSQLSILNQRRLFLFSKYHKHEIINIIKEELPEDSS